MIKERVMPTWCRILMMCALLAACHPAGFPGPAVGARPPAVLPPTLPSAWIEPASEGTWVGLLPCSDCQGIDTRLVLRSKAGRRDYLLTETYVGSRGKNSFNRAGTWTQLRESLGGEPATLYILDPGRSGPRFQLQDDGALELLDDQGRLPDPPVAYRLQRL